MPKENRNPPKQLTGPQGMGTLLTESNERFARLEEKVDTLNKLVSEILAVVVPAEETLNEVLSMMTPTKEVASDTTAEDDKAKATETKPATKADAKTKK